MKPPFISFFSSLIPSWHFFNRVGDVAQLSYRIKTASGTMSPWLLFQPERPATVFSWIFNPHGNLVQAQHSLIQRFAEEFLETSQVESMVSFQLIERLVQREISKPDVHFQWKISLWPAGTEIFVSTFSGALR